jgi:hypothetical protein
MGGIAYACEEDEKTQERVDGCFQMAIVFIVSIFIFMITPSKSDMVQMYVANYVTTNNQIKQLPKVVVEYLKKKVKESE